MEMILAWIAGKEPSPPIRVMPVAEDFCLDYALWIFRMTPDIQRIQLATKEPAEFMHWNWVPNIVMLDPLDVGLFKIDINH